MTRIDTLIPIAAIVAIALAGIAVSASAQPPPPDGTAAREVWNTEAAFARTMADRDHAGFVSFLAEEAVFLAETRTLRGKTEVANGWRRFYDGAQAPFSWGPDRVEVLASGSLALSSGPVVDPQGKRIGTFTSVWRREPDGRWRIVFDKGCPPCSGQ
jgi:ketosteroid isomerase-like protein